MLTDVSIVPMAAEHIAEIAALERRCFSRPWSENALTEELSNEQAYFLTALRGESVCGYIGVQEICSEAYITSVAVSEELRRCGLGTALLGAAAEGARARGCAFITLEVRESNAQAIALYKKMGFVSVGIRRGFYVAPTEDALIMTLNFEA